MAVTFSGGGYAGVLITTTQPVPLTDPYFRYNSLLLSGNGTNGAQNNTFLDGSTNNFTITRNGNTTQGTFSPYGSNWSNFFDGDDDYLSVANNAALNLGSSNYTIECWFYCSSAPTANDGIITKGNTSSVGSEAWSLEFVNSSGNIGYSVGAFNGMSAYLLSSSSAATINAWNHIAIVRNGTSHTMYLNGTSVATATASYTVTSAGSLYVGTGWYVPTVRDYIGYISNARLVVGTAVYTSNFTPSTTPLTAIANTSLLTCQSNRFIDNSTNNFTITKNGDVSVQRFSPFSPGATYSTSTIGGAGYFDGTGDYLSLPSTAPVYLSNNAFTIEAWVYPTANNIIIIGRRAAVAARGFSFTYGGFVNNKFSFYAGDTNTLAWELTLDSTNTFPLNQWYHVAVTRNASNVFTLWVNGASEATSTVSFTIGDDTSTLYIGTLDAGSSPFSGYISNLRLVTGTAVYTTAFTPPTSPVTAISGTGLLTNFTNAGIIDNTMLNNLETVGNAQISTAQTKFGGSSMYFDGTGDYLKFITSPNLQFGTGDFTIELWTYFIARGTNGSCFIGNYNNYTTGSLALFAGHIVGNTSKYQVSYNGSSFPSLQSTTSIIYNQWAHLALVRSGTTITLYINGVADGTITSASATLNGVGSNWFIGTAGDATTNYTVNGYIDDLRITKGYARYTSNFTPPTAELETL